MGGEGARGGAGGSLFEHQQTRRFGSPLPLEEAVQSKVDRDRVEEE